MNHLFSISTVILLTCLSIGTSLFGQKKVIDHTAYNGWKKNENQQVSSNGEVITYEINPHKGDGYLYIYSAVNNRLDSIPRGKEAYLSQNGDFVAFRIVPQADTLRSLELKKIDKNKWPKDSLGIYFTRTDSLAKTPRLKSLTMGKDNDWLCCTWEKDKTEESKTATSNKKRKKSGVKDSPEPINDVTNKKKKTTEKVLSDGKKLTVIDPIKGIRHELTEVVDFTIDEKGLWLAAVQHKKIKKDSNYLLLQNLMTSNCTTVGKYTSVKQLKFDKKGSELAFLASLDTAKAKVYSLFSVKTGAELPRLIADSLSLGIENKLSVSEHKTPIYTDNGKYVFFGVANKPETEKKDTLTEAEKVEVDVWHYMDKRLQTQQLVELKSDQKKASWYVYDRSRDTVLALTNDTLDANVFPKLQGDYLLASSSEAYQLALQWDAPGRDDYYRINLKSGEQTLLKKGVAFGGRMSPSGRYFTYFNDASLTYELMDAETGQVTCMTCTAKPINWQEDMNGVPGIAPPYGIVGFFNADSAVLLQSEYDLWLFDIQSSSLRSITQQFGESNKVRLNWIPWSSDSVYLSFQNAYINGFHEATKTNRLYTISEGGLREIYNAEQKLTLVKRSKDGTAIVFRKMSSIDFPEVRITQNLFANERVISVTNPQQKEYNWTKVELVSWKNYEGVPLEGLLYVPENFDPSQKYPMIVYYYELHSDDLHTHYVPKPTASIIYPTEYSSAGYVVFIPDIRYNPGHPAKSAYSSIMSGTDFLLKKYPFIDSTRMGLQGQSWGGYQTAQLITMTHRFRAAMAGAPVSNMFSAYGGIRWGSGLNRQFQYEKGQSRIGKTIWEAPDLYVENSPLFHLPNVTTPLLIMANDKDGAVPWYQGIELFTAMRRLGKPCWMLNYNGEEHNLMENANRMDLSIRMRQFFDHFLLGTPAPTWLEKGIPATMKGKTMGLDDVVPTTKEK
jgi:dipeptidyl aminopeptidase/acylaminoacyl peptidase